jgi:hypothetical protein
MIPSYAERRFPSQNPSYDLQIEQLSSVLSLTHLSVLLCMDIQCYKGDTVCFSKTSKFTCFRQLNFDNRVAKSMLIIFMYVMH